MTQSSTDFTQTPTVADSDSRSAAIKKEKIVAAADTATAASPQTAPPLAGSQHCNILLNNFQIKKKRYRVLLNHDHIVWERLKTKRVSDVEAECTLKKGEQHTEQLSQRAAYDSDAKMLHINELIRVGKGHTKSAALLITPPQLYADFGAHVVSEQQHQQQQQHQPVSSTPPTEQYLALSYAARIVKSATDCNRWEVHKLVLFNEDAYVVRQWHALLCKMLANTAPLRLRVRRLLVFINPFGGRKTGVEVYERHCKPLFQLAGIDASCILTQRSNQIRDILLSDDLTPFDAICCVGGDGTAAEVINGLIFRAICDAGMDPRQPAFVPKPALPIAIIPAGSTDTIAYSVHGTADVRTAAIHLILGQRRGMDICSVHNREGIIRFCASVLSYGYLGDVAAKSERYRWMGPKRYEYAGVKTFLANTGYEAEVRVLQPLGRESSAQVGNDTICGVNCERCSAAAVTEAELSSKRALTGKATMAEGAVPAAQVNDELPSSSNASLKSCEDDSEAYTGAESNKAYLEDAPQEMLNSDVSKNETVNDFATQLPGEVNAENSESASDQTTSTSHWKTVNGKFFMISGANITCACTRSPGGVARYSHVGDGYLDLILVQKTSLFNNIRLLLNLTSRSGDIRNLPFVETYRTKKFCFRSPNANLDEAYSISGSCQPIAQSYVQYDDEDNLSSWNCDGEVISEKELTMISHCQLIDVFMRGPHPYHKPWKSGKRSLLCCCCGCCKRDD